MNEDQESRAISKDKEDAKKRLLSLLSQHPQVFKAGIGAETFVDEFIEAFKKYITYSDNEIFAIDEISQIIKEYPQIISPETGAKNLLEDLNKAATKFSEYFKHIKQI